MSLTFTELERLITYAIIGLGFVLLYRSVPAGFVDKFREVAGEAADKTANPVDNIILQIWDSVRLLTGSNEQLKQLAEEKVSEETNPDKPRD